MSKRTPGPWKAVERSRWHDAIRIVGRRNVETARVSTDGQRNDSDENRANAEFIVRAVNAHDDLLASVREMVKAAGSLMGEATGGMPVQDWGQVNDALVAAGRAVAKAEGK